MAMSLPRAVFFDFDGTLVDSAPDLAGAVNDMRVEDGMPALPLESLRPYATYGARSLLKAGLGLTPDDPDYDAQRKRFLAIYDRRKLDHTHLFDGVLELLIALERRGLIWGIVTNKNSRLAEPMIHELLRDRAFTPAAGRGLVLELRAGRRLRRQHANPEAASGAAAAGRARCRD